jgi:hypothetical protein
MKIIRWLLLPVALLGLLTVLGVRIGRADLSGAARGNARSDLAALARLQGDYLEAHGRYAPDLETLGFSGLTTVDMRVDGESWAATAAYAQDGSLISFRVECAVVVGSPGIPWWGEVDMSATPSGEIRCED